MRKQPLQPRAQATCEAILQAAAHILAKDGYPRLTTNAVAAKAGVSIGSLYQYFPNKEELVAALREKHRDDMNAVIGFALSQGMGDTKSTLRQTVKATINAHLIDPELHRALSIKWATIGPIADGRDCSAPDPSSVLGHVKTWFEGLGIDRDTAARMGGVCCEIVEGLVHAALIDNRLALGPDALLDEIMLVIAPYVETSTSAQRRLASGSSSGTQSVQ